MKIALKELRETLIWLQIIERKPLCEPAKMASITNECDEPSGCKKEHVQLSFVPRISV
jgi:hypothetical protein